MKHIHVEGSWIIKAPIEDVFRIITDFESMPKNFPKVAESVTITNRKGVDIHKKWLRIIAKPLIGWFAMKAWERAGVSELCMQKFIYTLRSISKKAFFVPWEDGVIKLKKI